MGTGPLAQECGFGPEAERAEGRVVRADNPPTGLVGRGRNFQTDGTSRMPGADLRSWPPRH